MDFFQAAARCVGVPLGIAIVAVGLGFWLARRLARPAVRDAAAVLALGLGYIGGHIASVGLPPWPLTLMIEITHWPLLVAMAAVLVGLLEALVPLPGWLRWILRLALAALAIWLVMQPMLDPQRDDRLTARGLSVLALVVLGAWVNVQALAHRLGGAIVTFALGLVGAFASVALVLVAHSVVLAELSGALAVPLLIVWLAAWRAGGLGAGRGLVTVFVPVLAALVLNGLYYAELPLATAILIAVAPAGLWLAGLPPLARRPRLAAVVATLAVVAVLGLAVGAGVALAPQPAEAETNLEEL